MFISAYSAGTHGTSATREDNYTPVSKYNLIEVVLRGGPRSKQRIRLPRFATAVDIPRTGHRNVVFDRYRLREEPADSWLIFEFEETRRELSPDTV